jgi:7-cyano-7-deazaguanine synthase in queuosine biosynthesis
VIKGWIEDKESIPTSLQKGDALYFPECDPEVVHAAIEYMNSTTDGSIAILDPSAGGSKNALFYVKMYKFALCLG